MRQRARRRWISTPASAIAVVALGLSAALPVSPALAQAAPATEADERADKLFFEGRKAIQRNQFDKAYPLLLEAWSLRKAYDIAGLLGQAELELGKHRDAAEHLAYCLRSFSAKDAEKRSAVQALLDKAKREVMTVTVEVSEQHAQISVNGAVVGTSPLETPLFFDPGTHELEADLQGFDTATKTVEAIKGGETSVSLVLERSVGPVPAEPSPKTSEPATKDEGTRGSARTPVLVGGAVLTVLAGGTAAFFKLRASSAQDDVDDAKRLAFSQLGRNCSSKAEAPICGELADATDRRNSSHQVGNVALVATGVFGAATVATYLLWPSETQGVTAAPAASSSFVGVNMGGSF